MIHPSERIVPPILPIFLGSDTVSREEAVMKVRQAFCIRNGHGEGHDLWGNNTIEGLLLECPWLGHLVWALSTEEAFTDEERRLVRRRSALFFVDRKHGGRTRVSLDIRPSGKGTDAIIFRYTFRGRNAPRARELLRLLPKRPERPKRPR
jgi:hypothetical protein